MRFEQVVQDIKRLVGRKIRGIRDGVDITVTDVTDSAIILVTTTGLEKSRPLSEISRLWDALQTQSVIHVDSELGGSSSSRNQPETILANLPYIEYLYLHRKKHLAFTPTRLHQIGSIKEMSSADAHQMLNQLTGVSDTELARVVVVTSDVRKAVEGLQGVIGGTAQTLSQGRYRITSPKYAIYVIAASSTVLPEGTYPVIASPVKITGAQSVDIDGTLLTLAPIPGTSFLFGSD